MSTWNAAAYRQFGAIDALPFRAEADRLQGRPTRREGIDVNTGNTAAYHQFGLLEFDDRRAAAEVSP